MRIPLGIVASFLLAGFGAFAQQYNISTVAGGSPPPNNVSVTSVGLGGLGAISSDSVGNIYFVADDSVFEDQNGMLVRIAGNSRAGFSGDTGAAAAAQLYSPAGIALDNSGNLYISDSVNNRIRKVVLSTGVITTFAGTGIAGYGGDNGPAANAILNNPQSIAIDLAGNLYIADSGNNVIRKISNGNITTIAGTGFPGNGGIGQVATTAMLNKPMGVAVDGALNVYIADSGNNRILEFPQVGNPLQSGIIVPIAGNGIANFAGDNGPATASSLNNPTQVAVDSTGGIYVNDFNNGRVRKFTLNGNITTVPATVGVVRTPTGIAVDPNVNFYVSDSTSAQLFRVTPSGISAIAGNGQRYNLGDGAAATSAQLVQPQGLAVDVNGLYIADRGEARVRKINSGVISSLPVAANITGPAGVAVDASSNFYIADASGNQVLKVPPAGAPFAIAGNQQPGSAGDNGPAALAQLNQPNDVVLDSAGNIYIADTGNNKIRKVTVATGIITTIAGTGAASFGGDTGVATNAQLNQPTGLAVDSLGNVYVADTGNNRIREITPAGIITTIAGNGNNSSSGDSGLATAASISSPHGIAIDTNGNLYITDFSSRLRKVSPSGIIITIAGNGTAGYSGDNGPAVNAQLATPWGVTVDTSFNVYVSDVNEQAVRVLQPIASSQPSVTTTSPLPAGVIGRPYAATLMATGGTSPYSWVITAGQLPAGLQLSPAGSISGTPTASGSFLITVQATDSFLVTSNKAILEIDISQGAPGGLTITTQPVMIPGAVGVSYSQPLGASGGTPPYNWILIAGALPNGLTLSPSGIISGTPTTSGTASFTVRLNDNTGVITTQTFSLTVLSVGTLTRTGVFGHIAIGGSWTTRVYLTNISTSPVAINLVFRDDNGNPLTVPITVTQQGTVQQIGTNSFNGAMNPGTSIIIDSGAGVVNLFSGWVDVLSSGAANSLGGFAVFRTTAGNGTAQEGTAPLQTQFESKMDLQFDDAGGFLTGVAVVNLTSTATTVTATIMDLNGNQVGTYPLALGPFGHTAFELPNNFAVTGNLQGIVQFVNSNGGNIAGVGLRASTTTGTFTSVPIILP